MYPRQIWTGVVGTGTYRLIDMGPTVTATRFVIEQQLPPDALGGRGWSAIKFQYSDVLITAFTQLMGI